MDNQESSSSTRTPVRFVFDMYGFDTNEYAVEKDDGTGAKRRFLRGIASGLSVDGHGERMTEKAIKAMQGQAQKGDILLYADKHGVAYTDDIGLLKQAEILPTGDWQVEFRLYDKQDGIGANTLERADKLWRQMNGLPPYNKKFQRGFSIEGYIPEGGILRMSEDGRRVVDNVQLDGCVVVPRPAYQTSIVSGIYKALNEPAPWELRRVMNGLLADELERDSLSGYFRKRYRLQDALESMIESVMINPEIKNKKERLSEIFDEYKMMMIDILVKHPDAYDSQQEHSTNPVGEIAGIYAKGTKVELLKSLHENICRAEEILIKELV